MPGSLGGLVVSLGLNAAEFSSGLTKAEREAQKFAANFSDNVAAGIIKAQIALEALSAAATLAVKAIPDLIDQAGHFQDLAEKTGASAEELASLSIAAKVAGVNMDDLATFSIKLSKALSTADEDSSKVAKALATLGIPIQQFKALDPAAQMERLAKALAQFSDIGGGKAAVLEAIAKGGAQLLPFLKELEEGTGRQNILTAEQIRRADEFSDAQKRAAATLGVYAQALATEFAPAISAFTLAIRDVIKEMLGVGTSARGLPTNEVRTFAEQSALALAGLGDVVRGLIVTYEVLAEVGKRSAIVGAVTGETRKSWQSLAGDIDAVLQKETLLNRVRRQIAEQRAAEAARAIGPPAPERPTLKIPDFTKITNAAAISEAQRFLESLQKQLETTQELSTETKVLNQIRERGLVGLTPALEAQILAVAREIDAEKALKKAIEESRKAFEEERRAAEAAQKQRDKDADTAADVAQRIIDGNKALQDEIEIIKGGDAARAQLEQRRVQDAINIAEQARALALMDPLRSIEADNIRIQIEALQKRAQLLQEKTFVEQLRKDAEELQRFKNIFADTFADAFSSFIDGSKSAADAFKAFAKSVEQQITRLAAQNIGNAIFGGSTSGMDFSKIIGALLGAAAGGGGGAGWTSGFDLAGAATGGTIARGGLTVVGEQGPEVVNLPRGAQITSNQDSQKMFGPKMNFVINVLPGASTATAQQAAAATGIAVQRAMVRNT